MSCINTTFYVLTYNKLWSNTVYVFMLLLNFPCATIRKKFIRESPGFI